MESSSLVLKALKYRAEESLKKGVLMRFAMKTIFLYDECYDFPFQFLVF